MKYTLLILSLCLFSCTKKVDYICTCKNYATGEIKLQNTYAERNKRKAAHQCMLEETRYQSNYRFQSVECELK